MTSSTAGAAPLTQNERRPELAESTERNAHQRPSWFAVFTMALNVVGTVLILFIALLVNADILGRNLLNQPIPGVAEAVGLSIVAIVFLQLSNTLREGRHVANDLIVGWIGRRRPRVARLIYALFNLVGAFLLALIVRYVVPILIEDYRGAFYKGTAGVVEIPVWPFMAIVVIGGAAAALQYLLLSLSDLRQAFAAPPNDPMAAGR